MVSSFPLIHIKVRNRINKIISRLVLFQDYNNVVSFLAATPFPTTEAPATEAPPSDGIVKLLLTINES